MLIFLCSCDYSRRDVLYFSRVRALNRLNILYYRVYQLGKGLLTQGALNVLIDISDPKQLHLEHLIKFSFRKLTFLT